VAVLREQGRPVRPNPALGVSSAAAVVGVCLVLGLGGELARLRRLCRGRAGWGGALDKQAYPTSTAGRGGEQQTSNSEPVEDLEGGERRGGGEAFFDSSVFFLARGGCCGRESPADG